MEFWPPWLFLIPWVLCVQKTMPTIKPDNMPPNWWKYVFQKRLFFCLAVTSLSIQLHLGTEDESSNSAIKQCIVKCTWRRWSSNASAPRDVIKFKKCVQLCDVTNLREVWIFLWANLVRKTRNTWEFRLLTQIWGWYSYFMHSSLLISAKWHWPW